VVDDVSGEIESARKSMFHGGGSVSIPDIQRCECPVSWGIFGVNLAYMFL
jgi:hypothetical protein